MGEGCVDFNVGDRVERIGTCNTFFAPVGSVGVIAEIRELGSSGDVVVHWDHDPEFNFKRANYRAFLKNLSAAERKPVVSVLPVDAQSRKAIPLATGCLDYFPNALAEVAKISKAGNDQHNPGQPLHWSRGKSMDHADTIGRHLMERGTVDVDGTRHSAKLAWRALALLQEELEAAGAPMARGAWVDQPKEGSK